MRLSSSSSASAWPGGQCEPLHAVLGVDHVEDRARRLLLEPLARVALVDPGGARQLGGRRRPALRQRAIQAEPVADVHAAQVEGSDRCPEQPLDKSVPARLLGVGAGHCRLLRSNVPNTTKSRGVSRVASVAELLLFHHAHGPTEGFLTFADELRAAGHVVHAPDLYDGNTFAELADGVAYAKQVGFDVIIERGTAAAEGLPAEIVYAGFSLGVLPAQKLAQTRPGARGALLLNACMPTSEFDSPWPGGVPVQIHAMDADEWFQEDLAAARELVDEAESGELFLYPGDGHLFADSSLNDFDEEAAALLKKRILAFLAGVG